MLISKKNKMKNIFISVLGSLVLFSCSVDLDQSPEDRPTVDNVEGFESVLFQAYNYQKDVVNQQMYFGVFRSDNGDTDANGTGGEVPWEYFDVFDDNIQDNSEIIIQPFYDANYFCILSSNIVINGSDDTALVAEAKFLRALSYFKLVQTFGAVSINTSSVVGFIGNESAFVRQSVDDVYDLIVSDLQDAISGLGASIEDGRPSSYSASALLGKVYMTNGNEALAESYLEDVINSGEFELQASYSDIFTEELNSEIIFSIQFGDGDSTPEQFTDVYNGGFDKILSPVEEDLINAYETGDTRLDDSINDGDTAKTCIKYDSSNNEDNDWVELRYADVILLYAEAALINGSLTDAEVLDLLDDIRTRAGLAVLDEADYADSDEVLQAIKDERRVELAFEGHRWYDLVRWGDAADTMTALGETLDDSNYLLFPIPDSEVSATNGIIEQNPGYN